MFSNSSKYALKAVLYLAINASEEKKVLAKDIAAPINVPQAYIAKLLQTLSKQGLISSTKGPKGGFYLTESNRNHPVIDFIYAIDGEEKLNTCLLSLEKCNNSKPCPLHNLANASRVTLLQNLKTKTIANLADTVHSGNSFLPL